MYWKALDALQSGWRRTILELREAVSSAFLDLGTTRIDLGLWPFV